MPFQLLSLREREICRSLADGRRITKIASDMRLHKSTVATHKARIFGKFSVKTILELRKLADEHDFLENL